MMLIESSPHIQPTNQQLCSTSLLYLVLCVTACTLLNCTNNRREKNQEISSALTGQITVLVVLGYMAPWATPTHHHMNCQALYPTVPLLYVNVCRQQINTPINT